MAVDLFRKSAQISGFAHVKKVASPWKIEKKKIPVYLRRKDLQNGVGKF